jgi:hypothetical protein
MVTTVEHVSWDRNPHGTFHVEGWKDAGTVPCTCPGQPPIALIATIYKDRVSIIAEELYWHGPHGVCGACGRELDMINGQLTVIP